MENPSFLGKELLISSKDAGTRAGVTSDYISRLCRLGKIEGKKIGNTWYVKENSFAAFLTAQQAKKDLRRQTLSSTRRSEYKGHANVPLAVTTSSGVSSDSDRENDGPFFSGIFKYMRTTGFAVGVALLVVVLFWGSLLKASPYSETTYVRISSVVTPLSHFVSTTFPFLTQGIPSIEDDITAASENSANVFTSTFALLRPTLSLIGTHATNTFRAIVAVFTGEEAGSGITRFEDLANRDTVVVTENETEESTQESPSAAAVVLSVDDAETSVLTSPAVLGINTSVTVRDNISIGNGATVGGSLSVAGAATISGLLQANGGIITNGADINAGFGRVFGSNLVYSIRAGNNVTISGTPQNPIISARSGGFIRSSGGGSANFIGLTDTPAFLSANRIIFTNSAGDALTDNEEFTFDGTTLEAPALSITGTGTSSITALEVSTFSVTSSSATSTFANGLDISAGCYAIGGTCLAASISSTTGTIGTGIVGQLPYYAAGGNVLTATSSIFIDTNQNVGIGTTSPFARLSVQHTQGETPFAVSSSTETLFIINDLGQVGIGTSTFPNAFIDTYITGTSAGSVNERPTLLVENVDSAAFARPASFITPNVPDGSASGAILFGQSDEVGQAAHIYYVDSATTGEKRISFAFRQLGGDFFNILQDDRIGIGTTTPAGTLTVWGDGIGTGSDTLAEFVDSASSTLFTVLEAGNVGVGTTSPSSLFSIEGVANFTTATTSFSSTGGIDLAAGCFAIGGTCLEDSISSTTGTIGSGVIGQVPYFAANGNDLTATSTLFIDTNENVGIGTTTPYAKLSVWGDGTGTDILAEFVDSASTTLFTILENGNVGVSTTSPATDFAVSGNMYVTGGLGIGAVRDTDGLTIGTVVSCTGSNALQTDGTGGVVCGAIASLGVSTAGGWTTNSIGDVTLATTTDRVGIGATTTPYAKLSVLSGNAATTTLALVPNSGQTANIIDIYNTSGDLASVFTAGHNLGIGTTSPSAKLAVAGSGLFDGDLTISNLIATGTIDVQSTIGTSTIAGDLQIGSSIGDNKVRITADRNFSNSTSVGGLLNLTNTDNTGAGLVIYSNAGASTGRLLNVRADNPLFDQTALNIDYDGIANAVTINQNSTDSSSNALSITSTNPNDTALGVSGEEIGKGTVKITHNGSGADVNASALSILLTSTSTQSAAQGIFIDSSGGATLGKLLNIRNDGVEYLTLTAGGNLGLGTTSPYTALGVAGEVVADTFTATSTSATSSLPNTSVTNLSLSGVLYDVNTEEGTSGQLLSSTGSGVDWITASGIGLGDGTYLGLSDTPSSFTASAIPYTNAAGDQLLHSTGLTFNGTLLSTGVFTATSTSATSSLPNISSTNLALSGILYDTNTEAGTNGQVLSSTATGVDWIDANGLGVGDGTFLGLSDTPSAFNANRIPFTNSGGTALTDSSAFTFDGSILSVTGTARVNNGSAATPSLSFRNGTDTGIFLPSDNLLAFSTGGTERVRIDSAGNVGIGSSTPYAKLSVTNTGSGPSFIVEDSTSPDSTPFLIDADGNVGIGESSPGGKLDILATAADDHFIFDSDATDNLRIQFNESGTTQLSIRYDGTGTGDNNALEIYDEVNDIDLVHFNRGGEVGIGTTTTIAQLAASTTSNIGFLVDQHGTSDILQLQDAGSTVFTVQDGGNVGVGTTSPSSLFSIEGVANFTTATTSFSSTGGIDLTNGGCFAVGGTCLDSDASGIVGSGTAGQVPFYQSAGDTLTATSTIFIDTDSDVGVGTTDPDRDLHVFGTTGIKIEATNGQANGLYTNTGGQLVFVTNDTDETLFLNDDTAVLTLVAASANADTAFIFDGDVNWEVQNDGNGSLGDADSFQITDATAGETRFTIDTAGDVGIGSTSPYVALGVAGEVVADIFTATSTTATSTFAGGLAVETTGLVYDFSSNNVGIGTAAPLGNLHVTETSISIPNSALDLESTLILESADAVLDVFSNEVGSFGSKINLSEIDSGALVDKWGLVRNTTGGGSSLFITYGTDANSALNTNLFEFTTTGRFGIGTTTPTANLSVEQGAGEIGFAIGSSTATNFIVDADGNVGVGTTSPSSLFSIEGVANFTTATTSFSSTGGIDLTNGGCFAVGGVCLDSDASGIVNSGTQGQVAFYNATGDTVSGTSTLFIASTERVGIGTTTPDTSLQIDVGTNDGFLITNNSRSSGYEVFQVLEDGTDTVVSGGLNNDLIFKTLANTGSEGFIFRDSSDTQLVKFESDGDVGIGTAAPESQLTIHDSAANPTLIITPGTSSTIDPIIELHGNNAIGTEGLSIQYDNDVGDTYFNNVFTGSTDAFHFQSGGADLITVQSDGDVGIGTTSPYAALAVAGEVVADIFTATSTTATSTFAGGLAVETSGLVYDFSTNNVGIGTAAPASKLNVIDTSAGAETIPFIIQNASTDTNTTVGLRLGATTIVSGTLGNGIVDFKNTRQSDGSADLSILASPGSGSAPTDQIYLDSSLGNLGIGTTSPAFLLDVDGDLRVGEQGSANVFFVDATNSLVGVGTSSPSSLFSIEGVANFTTATSSFSSTGGIDLTNGGCFAVGGVCLDSDASGIVGSGTTGQVPYYAANGDTLTATSTIFIDTNENVGIGTTSPFAKLSIEGQGDAAFAVSDTSNNTDFIITSSGSVGIGVTDPASTLEVSAGSNQFRINESDTSKDWHIEVTGSHFAIVESTVTTPFTIEDGVAGNTLYLDDSDRVAIGHTAPDGKLHVSTETSGDAVVIIEADTDNNNEDDNPNLILRQDGNLVEGILGLGGTTPDYSGALANALFLEVLGTGGAVDFQIVTGGTTIGGDDGIARLTIDESGLTGIGTTTPGAQLAASTTNSVGLLVDQQGTSDIFRLLDAGTEVLVVEDGGNVGVGTTSPFANVSIDHDQGEIPFAIGSTSSTTLIVDANGHVGIGTTSPEEKLELHDGRFRITEGKPEHKGAITDDSTTVLDGATDIFVSGKYAYVTAINDGGLEILDISDPTNPTHVGAISTTTSSLLEESFSVFVSGNYAYIAASTSVAVIDVSNPTAPTLAGSIEDDATTALDGATDIFVSGKYAYVTGYFDDGVEILDISDPTNPTHVGSITDDATTELNGAFGIYVVGNYAYVGSDVDDGFQILDISDPTNPTHVGAITDNATTELSGAGFVYVSGRYAYVTGFSDNGLEILDISDPTNPTHVGAISDSATTSLALPVDVYVSGNYAYVTSSSEDGLQVLDVTDPTNPTPVGVINDDATTELDEAYGVFVSGKYAYVASRSDDGVEVLAISGVEAPGGYIGNLRANNVNVTEGLIVGGSALIQSGLNVGGDGLHVQGIGSFTKFATSTITDTHALNASFVDGNSSGITDVFNITHTASSSASDGIGTGLLFSAEDNSGNATSTGRIASILTSVGGATATSSALAFSTLNGTSLSERLRIDSNGNVGIGTSTPGSILDIESGASVLGPRIINNSETTGEDGNSLFAAETEIKSLRFHYSGPDNGADYTFGKISTINYNTEGTGWYNFSTRFDAGLAFSVSSDGTLSEALRISDTGNVGIGTTSPSSLFSIDGVSNFTTATTSFSSTGGLDLTNGGCFAVGGVCLDSDASGIVGSGTAGQVPFYQSAGDTLTATSTIFIATTGRVGIAQDTPDQLFHVGDNNDVRDNYIRVQAGANQKAGIEFIGGSINAWHVAHDDTAANLQFGLDSSEFLTIISTGDVGIGTTTPGSELAVTTSGSIGLTVDQQGTDDVLRLLDGGSEVFVVQDGGNVGIGSTTPNGRLVVRPSEGVNAELTIDGWNSLNTDIDGLLPGTTVGSLIQGPRSAHVTVGLQDNDTSDSFSVISGGTNYTTDETYDTLVFTAQAGGNVGIGTSTPYASLSVVGDTALDSNVIDFASSSAATLTINYATAATSTIPDNQLYAFSIATSTTATPILTIDTSGTGSYDVAATTTINGGFSVNSGALAYDYQSNETSIENLNLGALSFKADAGVLTWIDLPITNAALGTAESYTATIDDNAVLTVYGEADGDGGVSTSTLRVGIGTTSPYAKLSVLQDTGDIGFAVGSTTATSFIVDADGNVGVGTTSPSSLFSIDGVVNFTTATTTFSSSGGINLTSGCFAINGTCLDTNAMGVVGSGTTGQVPYYAANGETLTATSTLFIDTTEFVGIGTTSPESALHIAQQGNSAQFRITSYTNGTGGNAFLAFEEGTEDAFWSLGLRDLNNTFVISNDETLDGNEQFAITTAGNVGIGTTSPGQALSIEGDIQIDDTSSADPFIGFYANSDPIGFIFGDRDLDNFVLRHDSVSGNDHLVLSSDGRIGIGTTTPVTRLTIGDDTGNTPFLTAASGYDGIYVASEGSNGQITLETSGGVEGGIVGHSSEADIFLGAWSDHGVQIRANNTEYISLLSTGLVGIGSTTPYGQLSVTNTGSGPSFIVEDSASPDSTPFIVDASGLVGIGTANPSTELHISNSGIQRITVESSDNQAGIEFLSDSTGSTILYSPDGSDDLRFYDGSDRVTFESGGNVGIGTTNPTEKLHIQGDDSSIRLFTTTTNPSGRLEIRFGDLTEQIAFSYDGSLTQNDNKIHVRDLDGGIDWITFTRGGYFGVGSSSPSARLVASTTDTVGIIVDQRGTDDILRLLDAGTETFVVEDGGDVGLGIANPTSDLHLSGTGSQTLLIEADTDNSGEADQPTLTLRQDGGAVDLVIGFLNSENKASIYNTYTASDADIQFGAGNRRDDLLIDATAGAVGIGDLNPDARLEVSAEGGADELLYLSSDDDNDGDILAVLNSGEVGIGTSTPYASLSVVGDTALDSNVIDFASSSAATLTINYATAATSTIPDNQLYAFSIATSTTATPILTIDTSGTGSHDVAATTTINGGFSVNSGALAYDYQSNETSIENLLLGGVAFDEDAGAVTWVNLPIVNAVSGTVESFSATIDDEDVLTVYGEADGSGGVTSSTLRVGIGSTTPLANLSVAQDTGEIGFIVGSTTTNFIVDSTNNVGIGTSSPSSLFSIESVANFTTATTSFSSTGGINLTNGGCFAIGGTCLVSAGGTINSGTAGQVPYYAASGGDLTATSSLFIDTNGRVGINSESPLSSLYVFVDIVGDASVSNTVADYAISVPAVQSNTYQTILATSEAGQNANAAFGSLDDGGSGAQGWWFATGNNTSISERLRITSTGEVGIGTTTPSAQLAASTTNSIGLLVDQQGTSDILRLLDAGTTVFTVVDGGNVGIGDSSPDAALDVEGDVHLAIMPAHEQQGAIRIGRTGDVGRFHELIAYNSSTQAENFIDFALHTGTVNATSTVLSLRGDGKVGIGSSTPNSRLVVDSNGTVERVLSIEGNDNDSAQEIIAVIDENNFTEFTLTSAGDNGVTGATAYFRGDVGIGTTSPDSFLHVEETAADGQYLVDFHNLRTANAVNGLRIKVDLDTDAGNNDNLLTVEGDTETFFQVEGGGEVGIGTASAAHKLQVHQGTIGITGLAPSAEEDAIYIAVDGEQETNIAFVDDDDPVNQRFDITFSAVSQDLRFQSDTVDNILYLDQAGNVGIGAASPGSKLEVQWTSGVGVFVGDRTPFGTALYETDVNSGVVHAWFAEAGTRVFSVGAGGTGYFADDVGIGTTTPYARLSVVGDTALDSNVIDFASTSAATLTINYATAATSTIPDNQLYAFSIATSTTATPIFTIDTSGSGSFDVAATTTINGGVNINSGAFQYDYGSNETSIERLNLGPVRFDDDAGAVSWIDLPITSSAATGTTESFTAQIDSTSILTIYGQATGEVDATVTDVRVLIGTSTDAILGSSNIPYGSLIIADGALCVDDGEGANCDDAAIARGEIAAETTTIQNIDLAENYPTKDSDLEAGDLVMFDPENEVFVTKYDPAVVTSNNSFVGVISTEPGILLGGFGNVFFINETKVPVTLAGRVPVKVNLEGGPIEVGDRLTYSSTAGVATKATTSRMTLGVALEAYPEATATGTITALVDPQYIFSENEFAIHENGNVGIGTSDSDYQLNIGGDVAATGFVNVSSRATKKDIEALASTSILKLVETIENIEIAQYRYADEADDAPLRLGLIAEDAPAQVLSADGKGVDLYKLTTLTLAGVQELARQLDDIELRVEALEAGSTTETMTDNKSFIAVLKDFGISIVDNVTRIARLVATNLTVGSPENPTGITLYDEVTGEPYCVRVQNGELVPTPGECGESEEEEFETTPMLELLGDNPAYIEAGQTYFDAGVATTSEIVGTSTLVYVINDGEPQETFNFYTNDFGDHYIHYVITDSEGNIGTTTRKVIVFEESNPEFEGVETVKEPAKDVPEEETTENTTGTSTVEVVVEATPEVTAPASSTPSTPVKTAEEEPAPAKEVDESIASAGEKVDEAADITATSTEETASEVPAEKEESEPLFDAVAPVLTLNGDETMEILVNASFVDPGATAIDETDGDITDQIVIESTVDTSATGTYSIVYRVTDAGGNDASTKRTVIVTGPEFVE